MQTFQDPNPTLREFKQLASSTFQTSNSEFHTVNSKWNDSNSNALTVCTCTYVCTRVCMCDNLPPSQSSSASSLETPPSSNCANSWRVSLPSPFASKCANKFCSSPLPKPLSCFCGKKKEKKGEHRGATTKTNQSTSTSKPGVAIQIEIVEQPNGVEHRSIESWHECLHILIHMPKAKWQMLTHTHTTQTPRNTQQAN